MGDGASGATAHAGYRVSSSLPRFGRRHDDRLRTLVRSRAHAQSRLLLEALGAWFVAIFGADGHPRCVDLVPDWLHPRRTRNPRILLRRFPRSDDPRQSRRARPGSQPLASGIEWAFAQCPEFRAEIREHLPDYTHKIVWKNRPTELSDLQAQAKKNRAIFAAQAEAAERADAQTDWSALMVHFHNLDSLQHRLWPYLGIDATAIEQAGWNVEAESCLKSLDQSVGRLLDLAAKRDAAVIAVSDHGFGPCKALVNVNGLLRSAGLQRALMYGTRFRYRAQRLGDRFHRWLTRQAPGGPGRRLPRSVEGQVGCDWKRTLAYAPFGQLSGCIFLHPETTFDRGLGDQVTAEIIGRFRESQDPETGQPLFSDVFSTAERFGIDPAERGVPDILALSTDGYQAQAKWGVSLRNEILRPDPNLPATHWMDGVVAIDAPGVKPGGGLKANLHDIAPTTLAMLGLAIPETMNGRVIHEAFVEALDVHHGASPVIEENPDYQSLLAAGFGSDCN